MEHITETVSTNDSKRNRRKKNLISSYAFLFLCALVGRVFALDDDQLRWLLIVAIHPSLILHHIRRSCSLSTLQRYIFLLVRFITYDEMYDLLICPRKNARKGFSFLYRWTDECDDFTCVSTGEAFGQLEMQFFDFLVSLCSLFSPFLFLKNIKKKRCNLSFP